MYSIPTLSSLLAGACIALDVPFASAAPPRQSHGGAPTVTLASGVVVGTTTTIPSATASVDKFLGIPFAAPPVRFQPPQNPQPWSQPLNATAYTPACIQQFLYPLASQQFNEYLFNTPAPPESEDCLYLNVFVPATASAEAGCEEGGNWENGGGWGGDGHGYGGGHGGNHGGGYRGSNGGNPGAAGKAVMFWIYGGGLEFGTASNSAYDGSFLATHEDVIVVTTNYRTNVFGFVNSPELPITGQNLGFLDQRKALDWVQQNIAQFGADPAKVTIFGESAGGFSVKQLVAVPPSPLTFRAAIMESEATFLAGGVQSWDALAAALGCSNATSTAQFNCVQAAPASTIRTIIDQNILLFPPVIDNVTRSASVANAITSHTAAQIPFMLGTNSQEGRLFTIGVTNLTSYVQTTFPGLPALQAAILAAYPISEYGSAYHAAAAINTDITFQCPAAEIADLAAASGYDVWRYYFNASFPNTQLFPDAGVYHSSEIPLVFGTYPTANATAQEVALSAYMQHAWASFAKNPTAGPGWPRVSTNGAPDVGDLGGNGNFGEYTITEASVDFNCPLYAAVINATGL